MGFIKIKKISQKDKNKVAQPLRLQKSTETIQFIKPEATPEPEILLVEWNWIFIDWLALTLLESVTNHYWLSVTLYLSFILLFSFILYETYSTLILKPEKTLLMCTLQINIFVQYRS